MATARDGDEGGSPAPFRVPLAELEAKTKRALAKRGASDEEAARVTGALVSADLRGQHSHGVIRLSTICGRIEAGLIKPGAEPVFERVATSLLAVDGRAGFGQVVAWQVMERVVELADEVGVALATVRNNNHIGMLGNYLEEAAERGKILIVMTTSEAMVRPYGGRERMLGTNPIGIGIPARPRPFVLDMATSETAIGKLIEREARGEEIPDNWAVDEDGLPTTDPSAALAGAINPFGGAKGYGLGLAVSLLAGLMSGGDPDPEVVGTLDIENVCNKGDLFLAIDGETLAGRDFVERASRHLERIRQSAPVPGTDRVLVPGDRGTERALAAASEGVPIAPRVWDMIRSLS